MTFITLVREVEKYIRMEGQDVRDKVKSFINESIDIFLDLDDWEQCKVYETITLDGSLSYDLSSVLSSVFGRELSLINDSGTEYDKYGYKFYLLQTDRSLIYAIAGTTIYVIGSSGDLTFEYISAGADTVYPLVDDADDNTVTTYYAEIIKQMAIVRYLEWLGDDEAVAKEKNVLGDKLRIKKRAENRTRNAGKRKQIVRNSGIIE